MTASEQRAGRGRQGRTWFGAAGSSLLYSALLRPLGERPLLPLAVPLAVCEAAEEIASGVSCGVKWPNDVWVGHRKIAGILIESRPGGVEDSWAVIGIGLNVAVRRKDFPPELAETATSLLAESGEGAVLDVGDSLVALNRALGRWVDAPPQRVLAAFRERDVLAGRAVAWARGEGIVAGIDDSGHLLVDAAGKRVALGAGEVNLRTADPQAS